MRILVLEHLFPLPADSGGKIKSLCTIRALAAEHDVRLLSYVRTKEEQAAVPQLREICREVEVVPFERSRLADLRHATSSVLLRRSFIVTRDFRRAMLDRFRRAVREFEPDVVHIDHLQMAQFVDFDGCPEPVEGLRPEPVEGRYRTVLDQHNVESMVVKRIAETSNNPLMRAYAGLEWPKLLDYELEACRKADLVLTVSEEDAATLREGCFGISGSSGLASGTQPKSRNIGALREGCLGISSRSGSARGTEPESRNIGNVESVPIGVDVDSTPIVERDAGSRNILFLGTMYWPPNIDCVLYFHDRILPIVRRELPDCTFTIAGQRPPRAIERLARDPADLPPAPSCRRGGGGGRVKVLGYVSDTRELAAACGVFVVPLRSGSGVRVKILNAMAMGLPVVSTSIGAEGLSATHGEHLLIADSPPDLARAVVDVLTDPSLARELGRKGRELVEREYSWDVVGRRLLALYHERLSVRHSERSEESRLGKADSSLRSE